MENTSGSFLWVFGCFALEHRVLLVYSGLELTVRPQLLLCVLCGKHAPPRSASPASEELASHANIVSWVLPGAWQLKVKGQQLSPLVIEKPRHGPLV